MIYPDQSEASIIPGTEEGVIALLTKRFAISLKKVLSAQLHVTLATGEAAGVPGAAEGCDHLQYISQSEDSIQVT